MNAHNGIKLIAQLFEQIVADYGVSRLAGKLGVDRRYFSQRKRRGEPIPLPMLLKALEAMKIDSRTFFRHALGKPPTTNVRLRKTKSKAGKVLLERLNNVGAGQGT